MKKWIKLGFLVWVSSLLSSCTIGNGRICGPQTPVAYCDKEALEELLHPKPFIEYWIKPATTPIERSRDSIDCGSIGYDTAGDPVFTRERVESTQVLGEESFLAEKHVMADWQRCMIQKGYHVTKSYLLLIDKW